MEQAYKGLGSMVGGGVLRGLRPLVELGLAGNVGSSNLKCRYENPRSRRG
jgi:hypothetical protein